MLEYVKTILEKVSFDGKLFEKELFKALRMLKLDELKILKNWCYERFSRVYRAILNRAFAHV